ncbi:hypothetical protein [Nonomuraea sediminis]|uniref:hypothetical protein n=1 Tax=Nonomuraea sediminis TaxID=2835864 RepID=UPI001BDCCF3C|nr:hypothetical protein [Nonomuraea sediminis]
MRREEYEVPPQRTDDYDQPGDVLDNGPEARPRRDPDHEPESGMHSGPEARPRMDPDPEPLGTPQAKPEDDADPYAEADPDMPYAEADRDTTGMPYMGEHEGMTGEAQLIEQDPEVLQQRWRDVQSAFVDNPTEAVQQADGLVEEVVESLTSSLHARTSRLRESWRDGDTEQMRQALQDYRGVLERLMTLSGTR